MTDTTLPTWRAIDAPSSKPATSASPSKCPEDEVVDIPMEAKPTRPSRLDGMPSFAELLKHPDWRAYMTRPVTLPRNLQQEGKRPWLLWACKASPMIPLTPGVARWSHSWVKLECATYRDAFNGWLRARQQASAALVVDWAVTCRPKLFPIPPSKALRSTLSAEFDGCEWCPRCRRPVIYGVFRSHHAFHASSAVYGADARRCPYCAVRREQAVSQMGRLS